MWSELRKVIRGVGLPTTLRQSVLPLDQTSHVMDTNCLLGSADEGQVSVLIFLNLSAAFNALDHSSRFARLRQALVWFRPTCLLESRLKVSMVWSLHNRSLTMGFLRVQS